MIILRLHGEFARIVMRERLCSQAKGLGSPCQKMSSIYRTILTHPVTKHNPTQLPDQSHDAAMYVTIVIIFYVAIILLFVGSNLGRKTQQRKAANQTVVFGALQFHEPGSVHFPAKLGITNV